MKNTISADLNGVVELRKQLKYIKKNMQAIGAYEIQITGGHRKKLFRGEKTADGNLIINTLRKKNLDYMDNANTVMEAAGKRLSSVLIQYVSPRKMNKDNWSEIRETLRNQGRLYLLNLQKHWMSRGAGWNISGSWQKKKTRIQTTWDKMPPVPVGLPGIFTGRTIQNLRIQLKNQRFIKKMVA